MHVSTDMIPPVRANLFEFGPDGIPCALLANRCDTCGADFSRSDRAALLATAAAHLSRSRCHAMRWCTPVPLCMCHRPSGMRHPMPTVMSIFPKRRSEFLPSSAATTLKPSRWDKPLRCISN